MGGQYCYNIAAWGLGTMRGGDGTEDAATGRGVGFYDSYCPDAEDIVRSTVEQYYDKDATIAPGLLRLHFHDCFVQGCDGSILISGPSSERSAPQIFGLRGFEVIDDAKSYLEAVCPGVVSCADILALAARAHTIGQTDCRFVSYRLFNFTATGNADPSISEAFLPELRALCPAGGDPARRVALDRDSAGEFDVSFFKNVRDGNAALESDQRLWGDAATRAAVQRFAGNVRGLLGLRFAYEFPKAMVRMGGVGVKTGAQGEIRRTCSRIN
nr:unnamed protein product [Digitaria exilis]